MRVFFEYSKCIFSLMNKCSFCAFVWGLLNWCEQSGQIYSFNHFIILYYPKLAYSHFFFLLGVGGGMVEIEN